MIEKIQVYLKGMGISCPNKIIFAVASIISISDVSSVVKILNILKSRDDMQGEHFNIKLEDEYQKEICELLPKDIQNIVREFLNFQVIPKNIFQYVYEELLNCDCEELIDIVESIDVNEDDMNNRILDSKDVNRLVIKLLSIVQGKTLLNIDCGAGNFILQSCKSHLSKEIQGYTSYILDFYISKIRFYLQKDVTIESDLNDSFGIENEEKFDMIYASYPFASKYDMEEILPKVKKLNINLSQKRQIRFVGLISSLNLLDNLNEHGMIISIVPEGGLFNTLDKDFRKLMVDGNYLDAIISMPIGLFETCPNVKTALIILKKDRTISDPIYMIDAKEICEKLRRSVVFSDENIDEILKIYTEKKGICVSIDEIIQNDYYLGIERYNKVDSGLINPVSLKQVSKNIFRGYQIKASELDELVTDNIEETNYRIVNISDIHTEGYVDPNLTAIVVPDEKKFEKYCLEDGDIIITAKNTTVKIAVYKQEGKTKAILTGNLIAVRLNKELILPCYLKTFLDSSVGQSELRSIQTGTSIISITPNNLGEMNVSCLQIEEQRKLSDMFKSKIEEIRNILERYEVIKSELVNLYEKQSK